MYEKSKTVLKKAKENYDKPTPKKWRRIGDAILIAGTTASALSATIGNKYITLISVVLTGIGKIITNFTYK